MSIWSSGRKMFARHRVIPSITVYIKAHRPMIGPQANEDLILAIMFGSVFSIA